MNGHGIIKLLIITSFLIAVVATLPVGSAGSWSTTQSDDGELMSTSAWHNNQTDSKTLSVTGYSWHSVQTDSDNAATGSDQWYEVQGDDQNITSYIMEWYSVQTDYENAPAIMIQWYGVQDDQQSISAVHSYWYNVQNDTLVLGENGTSVLNSTVPNAIFQFGAFGSALIGILFIAIMILALVGRFR